MPIRTRNSPLGHSGSVPDTISAHTPILSKSKDRSRPGEAVSAYRDPIVVFTIIRKVDLDCAFPPDLVVKVGRAPIRSIGGGLVLVSIVNHGSALRATHGDIRGWASGVTRVTDDARVVHKRGRAGCRREAPPGWARLRALR